jgi:hypothetical protein
MRRPARGIALCALTLLAAATTAAPLSAGASGASVSIRAVSRNPLVTGDTWVTYGRYGYNMATLQGTAAGVAAGAVVDLFAQPFPFRSPATVVASAPLAVQGTSAGYRFTIAPEFATRYRVEVLATAQATAPEAVSRSVAVFATYFGTGSSAETCTGVSCTLTVHLSSLVPPRAIPVERHKHQFAYLSLPRSANGAQPSPTTYHLVSATVSAPKVSGNDLRYVLTITYAEPPYRYWYYWETCTRDTVGRDGLGLPGYHGCGKGTVSPATPYLG